MTLPWANDRQRPGAKAKDLMREYGTGPFKQGYRAWLRFYEYEEGLERMHDIESTLQDAIRINSPIRIELILVVRNRVWKENLYNREFDVDPRLVQQE